MVIFIHSILPTAFAQTNSRTEIHWDPVKHVVLPGDSTTSATLHFSGAASDFSKNFLPFYEEKIPLPSNDFIMEVEVKDQAYIQLPIDSLANVADIDKIDNELHVTTSTRIMRKQAYGFFKLHPYKKTESGDILLLQSFTLDVSFRLKQQKENKERHQYAANSVLSTGDWHKIKISRSGIFKLSYTDLAGYGIPVSSIDPAKIQVFGNGGKQLPYNNSNPNPDDLIENAIYVSDGNDGSFDPGDYILFYGQGPHSWKYNYRLKRFTYEQHEYDESAYYFITYGQATGKRIQQLTGPTQPANIFTSTYNSYRVHENDSLNLIKSGRRWFGEKYDIITDYNYNFNFPDLDQSQPVLFRISVAARHTSPTQFRFNINGNIRNMLIDAISGSYQSYYANSSTDTFSLSITSNTINIDATYQKPASTASGWMDYIEVNAREHLHFKAPQLEFRDINVTDSGNIAEYSISNASAGVMVWDINDVNNPVVVNTQLNGNTLSFKATADSIRNFIAHKNTYYKPVYAGTVANQNLHALAQPDMVIVTHPKLAEQAEEIAELHRNLDKMIVHVIEPGLIYNEFSSGQQDITAIRNFMRMFYDRATSTAEMPRYLLLMGDGNYDPKNRNNYDRATILTFQSYNSLNPGRSFVSDDYYGLLDPGEGVNASGALDIGIGRIPVGSTAEADNAVAKIKRYLRLDTAEINNELTANPALVPPLGDWKNEICLVADDEDGGSHVINADKLAKKINNMYPSYVVDKIYFDAYKQVTTPGGQRYPEANKAINETMRTGALIMNYIGDGGEAGWSHEEVLRISDINSWTNKYNLPVFLTATCEFSRFDDPERVSAGELVFLNPNGGAISMYTTSRLAYGSSNHDLNSAFYNNLFKKQNGEYLRMGDLMMLSKQDAGSQQSLLNFVLLGDPALQLPIPEKKVTTVSINGQDTSATDTLGALSKVTVKGKITSPNGVTDSSFNGIIYPTVYDKESTHHTLGQDTDSEVIKFKLRNNILYRGKSKVTNGHFSFSFIIPKDIAYNTGAGKIIYYAENGIIDANGYYDNFMIGGSNDSAETDVQGPDISLYMNDFSFESGDMTDENPLLLAKVFDENGINTVGNGIGHDIVAILDENTSNQIVINEYYESDLDDYKSGTIRYPFKNLEDGKHTLRVKVWDVYNNSAEASIEFVVNKSETVVLENLTAYPNPSDGKVWFTFDHNQAGSEMEFKVEIFSLDGRLIETLYSSSKSEGYSVAPLEWNARTSSGVPVEGGMYIYRATLRTESGISKQKSGKLVILY